jgi:hypothetical protein
MEKDKLRDSLSGLDRLLQEMPEAYGTENIGKLFRPLLYLSPLDENDVDPRSSTHIHALATFLVVPWLFYPLNLSLVSIIIAISPHHGNIHE